MIPMDMRSKVSICSHLAVEIIGSKATEDMDACLLCLLCVAYLATYTTHPSVAQSSSTEFV